MSNKFDDFANIPRARIFAKIYLRKESPSHRRLLFQIDFSEFSLVNFSHFPCEQLINSAINSLDAYQSFRKSNNGDFSLQFRTDL